MAIFSSTIWSAKLSGPWAIAPTNTTIEWVSGMVGKYLFSRTGLASNDKAIVSFDRSVIWFEQKERKWKSKKDREREGTGDGKEKDLLILWERVGRWSVMGFLMTLSNFSDPLIDRIESRWSNWTIRIQKSKPRSINESARMNKGIEFTHETTKSFECSRNTNTWIHFDQNSSRRMNVNL